MHPPWITFNFLLLLSSMTKAASGDAEQSAEAVNSTISRPQREVYERERRLIPYMTYYVTQSLTSPNGGAKQSILIPVAAQRGNIFQLDAVPKTPPSNIQNESPQPIQVLPKSVVRLTSPTFLTPTIQVGQYKPKEGIFPQVYRLESGIIRPSPIQAQVNPQQIQSETLPLQVVKVNPVPAEQKYTAPQIVKIIPAITKLPAEGSPPKSFDPPQPQFAYPGENVQGLPQHATTANHQIYYKESVPSHTETPFQGSKVYAGHVSRENVQPKLIAPPPAPDPNTYAVAKIILDTTPQPYNVQFSVNGAGPSTVENNVHRVSLAHLTRPDPPRVAYVQDSIASTVPSFESGKYVTVAPSTQPLTYDQRASGGPGQQSQYLIRSQEVERLPKLRVPEEEKIRFVASVTPASVTNDLESGHWKVKNEGQAEKNYDREPLNNIFALLKETNKLPQNLTPDNIDTGIKTLALILERLQQQRNFYHAQNIATKSSTTAESLAATISGDHKNPKKIHSFPARSGTSTPGRPGIDYPTYSTIPQTNFDCSTQRYKGFFGDPDTKCQVWHYCDLNGGQASFLCPNGTIFSQVALTCDWWFNVKCASTSQLYVLNERLYKYILPFSPSFPEDYSGPVVDTYLEAKFKEMEAKSRSKGQKSQANSTTTERTEFATEAPTNLPTEYAENHEKQSSEV